MPEVARVSGAEAIRALERLGIRIPRGFAIGAFVEGFNPQPDGSRHPFRLEPLALQRLRLEIGSVRPDPDVVALG